MGLKINLLWNNNNASAEFGAKNICDVPSEYSAVLIIVNEYNGANFHKPIIMPRGLTTYATNDNHEMIRKFTLNDSVLYCDDCKNVSASSVNNNCSVPLKVYGLK